jgi:hypothetical protein
MDFAPAFFVVSFLLTVEFEKLGGCVSQLLSAKADEM